MFFSFYKDKIMYDPTPCPPMSDPYIVSEFSKKYLFGLFSINILVENRNPPPHIRYKYKTIFEVKFLWKKFNFIIRSNHPGVLRVNGKRIE